MRNVVVRALALGVMIATPLSLPAQQAGDDANRPVQTADRDDHGEWGWLGLLGLAGLLGLKRRDHDAHVTRDGRAATR